MVIQNLLFSSGAAVTSLQDIPVAIAVFEAASSQLIAVNPEASRLLDYERPELAGDAAPANRIAVLGSDGQVCPWSNLPWVCTAENGVAIQAQELILSRHTGEQSRCLVSTRRVQTEPHGLPTVIVTLLDISLANHLQYTQTHVLTGALGELRVPLAAIKGISAMILGSRRMRTEAEYLELFRVIDEQADTLDEMLSTLADLNALDAGTLVLHPEPVLLEDILFEVKGVFQRSGHINAVQVKGISSTVWVNADRQRLVQLMAILLDQAANRSPVGAILTILCKSGENNQIYLEFRDPSDGASSEQLNAALAGIASSTRHAPAGLLGLTIAKGIVEAHGGRIWVESQGDQPGLTVVITLPGALPAVIGKMGTGLGKAAPSAFHSGTGARVLAVTAEAQTLRLLRRILGEAGYRVYSSGNLQHGLTVLDSENIDLVVLDASFDVDGGSGALRLIREQFDVPLILVAGGVAEAGAIRALSAGADDYLTKPFAPEELIVRVGAILRRTLTTENVVIPPPFTLGALTIDYGKHHVTLNGRVVELSTQQFRLLSVLSMNHGRIMSHKELLRAVWGSSYEGEVELLRSMIRNLRKRLNDGTRTDYILSVRSVGYRMALS